MRMLLSVLVFLPRYTSLNIVADHATNTAAVSIECGNKVKRMNGCYFRYK